MYCRVYLNGRVRRKCTGVTTVEAAQQYAETWYLDLMIAKRVGNLPTLPGGPKPVPFKTAYESFIKRAELAKKVTPGQIKNYRDKWTLFQSDEYVIDGKGLGTMALAHVTNEWLEALRAKRKASTHIVDALGRTRIREKPVSNNTLSKDMDFLRLVLAHAHERDKTLEKMPIFPEFEGRFWAIEDNPGPAFPPRMWLDLKRKLRAYAAEPNLNPRTRRQRQELYAFAMMCVGAAMRPSEAYSLRWKDCWLGHLGKLECVHLRVRGKRAKFANTNKRLRGWALLSARVYHLGSTFIMRG